jgi:tetratricopeptide (TPR) repeat protein
MVRRPDRSGPRRAGVCWLVVLVGLLSACAQGPTLEAVQRARARALRPVALGSTPELAEAPRTISVRVWATEGLRRLNAGFETRLVRQVEVANRVLLDTFGLRLELTQIRPWALDYEPLDLDAALRTLEQSDPGEGVHLVLGLIGPLERPADHQHELGAARLFGRHLVLRGADEAEEQEALASALSTLPPREVEALYLERSNHRAAVLLLHELGHLLGALHSEAPTDLMHPRYSLARSNYLAGARALLGEALACLLEAHAPKPGSQSRRGPDDACRARLAERVGRPDEPSWRPEERAHLVRLLAEPERLARASDSIFSPAPVVPPAGVPMPGRGDTLSDQAVRELSRGFRRGAAAPPRPAPPSAPTVSLAEVRAASERGDHEAAEALLERARKERGPDDPELLALDCELCARRAPEGEAAPAVCRRAMEAAKESAAPAIVLAWLHDRRGEPDAALAAAREAEQRMRAGKLKDARAWLTLAQLYRNLLAPTLALGALEGADEAQAAAISSWARDLRARHGVPAEARALGLEPEAESSYHRARRALAEAAARKDDAAAEAEAARLAEKYPRLAPRAELLCEAFGSRQRWEASERWCRRALDEAKQPAATAAPLVHLGAAALARGRVAEAKKRLEPALERAPERRDLYRLLAMVYRARGDKKSLRRLAEAHRARFGAELE